MPKCINPCTVYGFVYMLKAKRQFARRMARSFLDDDRGQTQAATQVVGLVVALTVGSLVAAFILPIGIEELVGIDTSAWSDGATSLWEILDVIIVLSLFLFFIAVALASADNL